tara:strand:+ start:189 stop:731 length:543 start_codon:yes stop_codon:yes gene_type:complete
MEKNDSQNVDIRIDPYYSYEEQTRLDDANELVRKYTSFSMILGLVPIPFLDVLVISGAQLKMLYAMSEIYGDDSNKDRSKKIIASVIGGMASQAIGRYIFGRLIGSLLKFIPGIGTIIGVLAVSLLSGATTYAIGKLFIQHFESGGTFLNFDPEGVREYYAEQFKDGKKIVEKTAESENA